MADYVTDPAEIYRQSFAIIEEEADLSEFSGLSKTIVRRMIHACGMVDLATDCIASDNVGQVAHDALRKGGKILVDAEMVRSGIIAARLPIGCEILCTLNAPRVRNLASALGTTRSAAAVELWKPHIEGSIIVIGNAPTALFHLLDRLDKGWPKPAAIFGLPVGFVGAAESKAALKDRAKDIPFLTVQGRRGGSAMASAAVNALFGQADG